MHQLLLDVNISRPEMQPGYEQPATTHLRGNDTSRRTSTSAFRRRSTCAVASSPFAAACNRKGEAVAV